MCPLYKTAQSSPMYISPLQWCSELSAMCSQIAIRSQLSQLCCALLKAHQPCLQLVLSKTCTLRCRMYKMSMSQLATRIVGSKEVKTKVCTLCACLIEESPVVHNCSEYNIYIWDMSLVVLAIYLHKAYGMCGDTMGGTLQSLLVKDPVKKLWGVWLRITLTDYNIWEHHKTHFFFYETHPCGVGTPPLTCPWLRFYARVCVCAHAHAKY